MLTEEQIKNLKKGDTVMFTSEVALITDDFACIVTPDDDSSKAMVSYEDLSMPPSPPKYDPCRKFKKGDKVRIVEWNGRIPQYLADCIDSEHTVRYDEDINGGVHIEGTIDRTLACYLELVTPVEESDKYIVRETNLCFSVCKRNEFLDSSACFNKKHPLAREHAEKYCAALNAEYRKEAQQ